MIAYAVTDPSILNFATLDSDLLRIASRADMVLYRDKGNQDYSKDALRFMEKAGEKFLRILLHRDIDLALALGADGIHLTSLQSGDIEKAKKSGLFTIISTHTEKEVKIAADRGADMVTLSPVFHSPGKGRPLGIEKFADIVKYADIPVIALGGILSNHEIALCEKAGAAGFASIRYFK